MDRKIAIGLLLWNDEKYIARAIESLLGQTHRDFRLLIVNDCSSDSSLAIAREYAAKDDRITCFENARRLGIAGNSRRAFELAGDVDYFAWAAGHDEHQPDWLTQMIGALETYPEAVMAYPLVKRISKTGAELNFGPRRLDTTGLSRSARIARLGRHRAGYGDMIYGLFRASALRSAGVYPTLLSPDEVLLWRLALQGSFVQVPEVLWHRRFTSEFSLSRQRKTVTNGAWYSYLPFPIVNASHLLWHTALASEEHSLDQRAAGLHLSLAYLLTRRYAWLRFR
jgi:glycosyltransferase involved in cell wall biosynthesis